MKFVITAALAAAASPALGNPGVSTAPPGGVGEAVDRICFTSSINRWERADEEGHVLLVDRAANDWYRLELHGTCGAVANFSSRISFVTKPGSGCLAEGDMITVTDPGGLERSCRIKNINRWISETPVGATE